MTLSFALGPGPGLRLLAPGHPDWIGSDGRRVGWVVRDRLFLHFGDEARMVVLPDLVEEVCPHPAGWVVALGQGFVVVDPDTAALTAVVLDEEADPVTTRPGAQVGLFVEVPEHRLVRVADGRTVPIPDGATVARWIRPWATGVGAVWVSGDVLYRLGARVEAIGRAPGAAGIAVGPEGAVVVALGADAVVAAPRGLASRLGEHVDAASVRFSPDGAFAWAAGEEGAVRIDLAAARVVERRPGSLLPVGEGPLFLDAARAAVVDGAGAELLGGFGGATPARSGRLLVGPGGDAWHLDTGAHEAGGWFEGVLVTDGARVVHVVDGEARVRGGPTFRHGLGMEGDEVVAGRIDGETLILVTQDGEQGRFALADGAVGERSHKRPPAGPRPDLCAGAWVSGEGADSEVRVGERSWPVPADGVARVGELHWAWTREGMLIQLDG